MRPIVLAGVLGAFVVAAACGGGGAAPPAADDTEKDFTVNGSCALFTPTEAKSLLKSDIERKRREGPFRSPIDPAVEDSCFYRGEGGVIKVTLTRFDNPLDAKQRQEKRRGMYKGSDVRDVAVGDAAFWLRKILYVHKHDMHLSVQVEFNDDRKFTHYSDTAAIDALIAIEKQLAEEALKRVPTIKS